jgi:broad specificity phosphatase PhoE
MPNEIVIVRHGLCSGNAAERASSKGDHSLFTEVLRQQDSSIWSLLQIGIQQSQKAGRWIQSSISEDFDCYLASDMTRASETAFHLGFKDAVWETEILLRERSWGGTESMSNPERFELCTNLGVSPVEDSMDWSPPNGESMTMVLERMRAFLKGAKQKFRGKKLLLVSHGAPIQALRVLQHRVFGSEYLPFVSGNNYVRNCHIFHYFSPKDGGNDLPLFKFERSAFLNPDGSWSVTVQKID